MNEAPPPRELLDPCVRTVWKLHSALQGAVLVAVAVGAGAAFRVWGLTWLLAAVPAVVAIGWMALDVWVLPEVRYRYWRWELGEEEIDLQRGLVTITRQVIPMARVQHVDTRRGFLHRRYGLAEVVVYTAAGSSEIPGLAREVADGLRDRIAALANTRDDM